MGSYLDCKAGIIVLNDRFDGVKMTALAAMEIKGSAETIIGPWAYSSR